MLDQSLLQSHFIGRDGFRWWIGQVPPIEDDNGDIWSEQANQDGWGTRVKVRILGYHTLDTTELSNKDLPWAQVMMPTTTGSGSAFYASRSKVRQGDMVIGFFLDGDNAQIPIIIGVFSKGELWSEKEYSGPFTPFTGNTKNIPKIDPSMRDGTPTNDNIRTAQGAPQVVNPKTQKPSTFSGTGMNVVLANTCENTTQAVVKSEIDNLLNTIQNTQGKISEYKQKIQNAAEVIKGALGWIVNEMFSRLELFLVGTQEKPGIIPRGIQALYTAVYGSVYAATLDPAPSHRAGAKAESVLILPVNALERLLVCIKNEVIDTLASLIEKVLESLLENVKNFVSCAAEQFVGVVLNTVVDQVSNGLSSALDGVLGVLGVAFDVASFIRDIPGLLSGLFDCGQSNTKCDGTKEWKIAIGPKSFEETNFKNVSNALNTIGSKINSITEGVSGVIDDFTETANIISSTADIFNGNSSLPQGSLDRCYTGIAIDYGVGTIKIFGGGGTGAEAIPIFGGIVQSVNDLTQTVYRSGSIIGAIVTKKGSGYRFPPFVEITDNYDLGYGSKGRAVINDKGELESIYIVSSGTGYPAGDQGPSGVVKTVIQSSGLNYTIGDTAFDNFGNEYELIIEDGRILGAQPINSVEVPDIPLISVNSETGFGAVISPVFGSITQSSKIQTQIDCPI